MAFPLRILHFIHTPRHSGAEMLVYDLCRIHRARGHDCAIASFAPSQPEFEREVDALSRIGVSLFFPNSPRKKIARIIQFRDAVRRFRPDAVFGHSELPSLYGRFATGLGEARVPFISVLHAASNRNFESPLLMLAERVTRRSVNSVVAVSEEGRRNYIRHFAERIPVSIIKNGIDVPRFSKVDRKAAQKRLGLSSDTPVAVQVGRVCDIKQQHLALAALKPLLRQGKVLLWFAGLTEDRAYAERLRGMIAEWGVDNTVRFLGSRADVPDLLAAADLYLMPSRREAHSVAILEALASGVPIVASDIPAFAFAQGMPSVSICGVEDMPAWSSAAQEMLRAPRAHRDIGEFSIERTAQAYLDVARALQV